MSLGSCPRGNNRATEMLESSPAALDAFVELWRFLNEGLLVELKSLIEFPRLVVDDSRRTTGNGLYSH